MNERIWRLERYSNNAVEIVSFWMMGIVEGIEECGCVKDEVDNKLAKMLEK